MPFGKKRSATKAYLDKKKNDKRTVIDEINDTLNSVHYICPTKEECEKIKLDFKVLNENLSEQDKDLNINEVAKGIEEVIEKYPSTLKDGQNFDNNGPVPDKVLKDISKRCGLTYGKTTRENIGLEQTKGKSKMTTVKHHFDRLINKLKSKNYEITDKKIDKTIDDRFMNLRKKINDFLTKKDFNFESKENKINNILATKEDIRKNIIRKLDRYIADLSSIIETIELAASRLEKKHNTNYVLAFGVGKFDFWGIVCRFLYHEDNYGQFRTSQEVREVKDEIGKLMNEIKELRTKIAGDDNNYIDIWSSFYKFKDQILSLCKKVKHIRSGEYVDTLFNIVEENLEELEEISNEYTKAKEINVKNFSIGEIDKEISGIGNNVLRLEHLKSMKIMHKAKFWIKNNWLKIVQGMPDDVEKLKKKLKSLGIVI